MTLIEIGFLFSCLMAGILGYVIGSSYWGPYAAWVAAVAGFILPFGGIYALRVVSRILQACFPPRPVCENVKCHWDDYDVVICAGDEILFVCKCGKKYARSGARFLRVLDDGNKAPYMILKANRQWAADDKDEHG